MLLSFLGLLTAPVKSGKSAKRKRKILTARPMLAVESLEERAVPSATVYDIPGQGVYLFNSPGGGLTHISTRDAHALAINDGPGYDNLPGEVVAAFSDGVYTYYGSSWHKLTSSYATKVDIDNHGNVVGDFPNLGSYGKGLWIYYASNGTWSHITTNDSTLLCISQNAVVTGEFPNLGTASGVWIYNGSWSRLTAANASSIDVDQSGNFVGEFPGQGVWIHYATNGTWSHITTADAGQVAIGGGIVAASFTSASDQGLWLYHESTNAWSRPTAATPSVVAADSWGEVAGEYGSGLWTYTNGSSWGHVSSASNISLLDIGISYYLT
jgi:hypothetical protein